MIGHPNEWNVFEIRVRIAPSYIGMHACKPDFLDTICGVASHVEAKGVKCGTLIVERESMKSLLNARAELGVSERNRPYGQIDGSPELLDGYTEGFYGIEEASKPYRNDRTILILRFPANLLVTAMSE